MTFSKASLDGVSKAELERRIGIHGDRGIA